MKSLLCVKATTTDESTVGRQKYTARMQLTLNSIYVVCAAVAGEVKCDGVRWEL